MQSPSTPRATALQADVRAREVVRQAFATSGRTQEAAARALGIGQGPFSRRLNGETSRGWTVGELLALGQWLGQDLLTQALQAPSGGAE